MCLEKSELKSGGHTKSKILVCNFEKSSTLMFKVIHGIWTPWGHDKLMIFFLFSKIDLANDIRGIK